MADLGWPRIVPPFAIVPHSKKVSGWISGGTNGLFQIPQFVILNWKSENTERFQT